MPAFILATLVLLLSAPHASAAALDQPPSPWPAQPAHSPWQVSWLSPADDGIAGPRPSALVLPSVEFQEPDAGGQPVHAAAVEYSDAYQTRKKIHKYASFATLPLFAAELALGQSLYNDSTNDSRKGLHAAVGAGIIGLVGVNTVTGAWNMFGEGWSERQGRTLRLVHGLLMMAADAGFMATWASAPNSGSQRQALTFETNKTTHRNIAVASISVGTASYLIMLLANH